MHNIFQYKKNKNDVVYDQNKLDFGRAIIGLEKKYSLIHLRFSYELSLVFDQQIAFEYFDNCCDHKAITKIARPMFGLTRMNAVKVEKMRPYLKEWGLRSRRLTPTLHT